MPAGSYLDSSFLWKLYLPEKDSDSAIASLRDFAGPAYFSDLTDVEMASSLYRQLPHSEASAVYAVYRKNCEAGMYQHLRLNEAVYARATELAGMLAGPFGLRSLDTLHLATALVAGVETMATFDQRLARAAKAAGMKLLR